MNDQIKIEDIIDARPTADGKSISLHVRLQGGGEACVLLDVRTALFLNPAAHLALADLTPLGHTAKQQTDKQQNIRLAYKPRTVSVSYSPDDSSVILHFDDNVPTQQQYVLSEDQFLDFARDIRAVLAAIHGGQDKLN